LETDAMTASASLHPTDQTLSAYGLGKLDVASAESVNKHVESCSDCQRRVAELSSDSFLGRLRGAQGRSDSPAPIMSSTDGLSMPAAGPDSPALPPASTLPPGLADHPDYEILRELGRGGMGVVYLAQNKIMGRTEVLKVVGGHLINRRGVVDRFLAEIRNAARLRHPNIVTAYSVVRVAESLVLAMEHVEGLDLAQMVHARGPLPVAQACNYVYQAALGLQHAHEHGMVHRDIKPSNLMLTRQGNRALIKVLDFGLAKVQSEGAVDGGLTHEGQMLGTPDYIAPEQISDARRADTRADIYSLGCTLYYLLTGGPPFQGTSLYDILQAHHSMDAKPLNLARPEVPVELAALVAKMMAKEPERRFQEPREIAQALTPFFKKGSVGAHVSIAEVSQDRQTESKPQKTGTSSASRRPKSNVADSPPPSGKRLAGASGPQSIWDSLIELEKAEPPRQTPPVLASARRSPRRWIWPAAGLFVFALLTAVALGVFMLRTASGTIVIDNLPEDAVVEVDGERLTIRPSGGEPLSIEKAAGNHAVVVMWRDALLLRESVAVESGKKLKLTIRLDPPDATEKKSPVDPKAGTVVNVRDEPRTTSATSEPPSASTAAVESSALDRRILAKLDMPIPMKYSDGTPLENVLKDIKRATKGPTDSGIPIYVDPIGLQEAEQSLTSPIAMINIADVPLKTTLPIVLKKLDLMHYVADGLLIITSAEHSVDEHLSYLKRVVTNDKSTRTKAIVAKLGELILMPYDKETPLEDVLKYIQTATRGPAYSGIPIYVDPIGLQESEQSLTSTIRISVEGVPLRTTLRLLLRPLDLNYYVDDGLLVIISNEQMSKRRQE
jgi:serine/threonine protein kinase